MPYIDEKIRKIIEVQQIDLHITPGILNYKITKMLLEYVESMGLSYETINSVMGILSCVSQEFYRRVAVPYEEKKMEENGDVFILKGE